MEVSNQQFACDYDYDDNYNTDDNTEYTGKISSNDALVSMAAEQYGSHLRTYFYNRLRSYNDVDDLLQELYCRLLTYQNPLRVKSLKSFVFTIALNLLRDKSRRTVTRMASKMTPIDEAEDIPAEIADPTRVIEGMEDLVRVGEYIDELQPSCKKAFYLHRIHGLSHKEIALRLGVTVSMVEKHIMAAMKHLRKEMAEVA